jgi:hypothetical protein
MPRQLGSASPRALTSRLAALMAWTIPSTLGSKRALSTSRAIREATSPAA